MAVLLPDSVFAQVSLLVALAAIPYAYLGRYKASLVFLYAFTIIFAIQLVGWFVAPIDQTVRVGEESFLVTWDPVEWELAMQPAEFRAGQEWWTVATHMAVHSNFIHILGNGISLWIFGPKLEQHIGTRAFANLYLVAGLFAGLVTLAILPDSSTRMLGASGAISGVMGLYAVRFPRDRIWFPIGFLPIQLPAWGFIIVFTLYQFYIAFAVQGVAWWAHLAGLLIGLLVGAGMAIRQRARRRGRYEPEDGAAWTVEHYGR